MDIRTCPHGHLYTEDNTYHREDGRTECRTCRRITARRVARECREAWRALKELEA